MPSKWLRTQGKSVGSKKIAEVADEVQLSKATLQQATAVDLQQDSEITSVPKFSEQVSKAEQKDIPHFKLSPAALRLYPIYERIDSKGYISPEDFNRICLLVGGDTRRVFQRVLLGIYQRAHIKKNGADVKKARTLLSLHESGSLIPNINNLNEEMFL